MLRDDGERLIAVQPKLARLQLELPRRFHGQNVVGAVDRAGDLQHADPPIGRFPADQPDVAAVTGAIILLPPRPNPPAPVAEPT